MAELKDSGDRTEYSTGAVRDCKEGKGRCDLMPIDILAEILNSDSLNSIAYFKKTGNPHELVNAISYFAHSNNVTTIRMMLEVSKHFEDGAKKYGENNWQKGIPVHSYIDSAIRHYLKWLDGWTDEPHDRAFVWNLMCAMWTVKNHPELDDYTENEEERKKRLKEMLNKLYGKDSVKYYADIANKGE